MRPLAALSLVALLAAATGCPAGSPAPPAAAGFKAALLTPGPVSDAGWNALAYDGLKRIEKELGATVEHARQGNAGRFEDDLRDFAQRGASVVFAHGFEYQDACEKVAARFPGTVFVVSGGRRAFAPNGACLLVRLDDGCYLAGILAAHLTRTRKIGAVGGMAIPSVKAGFEAFARGARRARPDVEVVPPAYLDSWDDVAKGKEQGLALVGAGCDVLIHNADHAGLGVLDAAKSKGIRAIGSNRDQNAVEPGTVVASATADVARCMLDLAREVQEGRFKSREVVLDARAGYVDLTLAPGVEVPADARKQIDEARTAIVSGKLDPGKD